jgi:class 3 adenylate cyclase
MANLDLIKRLNSNYGKNSPISRETRLFEISESMNPENIQRAFSNSIANLGPKFTQYFDNGLPANVVLQFIDVCGFSTRFGELSGEEIGKYFDEYYDLVIPIIYKHGGEIDKIMGDGIICVFGPPFQDLTLRQNIMKADKCSKEIIKKTEATKFASKVAIHSGTINYFKNKTGLYKEFTIIGKPLTELFRLESISIDQRINYYDGTEIRSYYSELISQSNTFVSRPFEWTHFPIAIRDLKGVNYSQFFSIKHNL